MPKRRAPIVVAALVALVMPTSVWAAPGPNRPTADQGATVFLDNCPFPPLPLPTADTACTAIQVSAFRHRTPASQPEEWAAFAEIQQVVIHPDGTFDVPDVVNGLASNATGTFDEHQLSATSLVAAVPMSDGSTLAVDLRWTADEKINQGTAPYWSMPAARHFANVCTSAVFDYRNVRPKIRHSSVSGTIGGDSIADLIHSGYTVWFSESNNNLVVPGDLGRCPS